MSLSLPQTPMRIGTVSLVVRDLPGMSAVRREVMGPAETGNAAVRQDDAIHLSDPAGFGIAVRKG